MTYSLNRTQYSILSILKDYGAITDMNSMSCDEIRDAGMQVKIPTIYKHIRILKDFGYVRQGAKVERANGYIITEQGLMVLPEMK